MFGAACKGLHCACCKTFGVGPLLFLLILYVISALSSSAILALLIHVAMAATVILAGCSIMIGVTYALLSRVLKNHIRVDTGRPSYEVNSARYSASQAAIHSLAPPAFDNHRSIPVLYRPANEPGTEGQRIILERRDER